MNSTGQRTGLVVMVSALALTLAFTLGRRTVHPAAEVQQTPTTQGPAYSAALQDTISAARRNAIVLASQRVAPAVVSVNVRAASPRSQSFFDMFFYGQPRDQFGLGSGFIIRPEGLVVTNEHVVQGATEIVVTLADGRDFPAEVVGIDEITDIALLRLRNASNLPVAPLGTSKNLIIGEWAIAIGNPFGFSLSNAEPSVTAGVISGVGRNIVPGGGDSGGMYVA
jgi:serine protease Do